MFGEVPLSLRDHNQTDRASVLTKAFFRAGDLLELSGKELAQIIGTSESTISRMRKDSGKSLVEKTKAWELAVLFVRIFRSLDAMLGGHHEKSRLWLRAYNEHLNGKPIDLVREVRGITLVAEYLDGMRGRG